MKKILLLFLLVSNFVLAFKNNSLNSEKKMYKETFYDNGNIQMIENLSRDHEGNPIDGYIKYFHKTSNRPMEYFVYKNGEKLESYEYFYDGTIYKEMIVSISGDRTNKLYHINGILLKEEIYKDEKKEKIVKAFFINQNLYYEHHYIDNNFVRRIYFYYNSGTIFQDITYNNTNKTMTFKVFYETGEKFKTINSNLKEFSYNVSHIYPSITDDLDVPKGKVRYYHKNGHILFKGNDDWKNNTFYGETGEIMSSSEMNFSGYSYNGNFYQLNSQLKHQYGENFEKHYDTNGTPATDFKSSSKFRTDGKYNSFHSNGQIRWDTIYKKDKLNGVLKAYYENGILEDEQLFKDQLLIRTNKESYENGFLKSEYDQKTNLQIYYDKYGNIIAKPYKKSY